MLFAGNVAKRAGMNWTGECPHFYRHAGSSTPSVPTPNPPMMHLLMPLLGFVGALTLGAMSPGPSFLMVAQLSVSASRRHGLAAAMGMGIGGVCFAALALLGLKALLANVAVLYGWLRIGGGMYLIYIGTTMWRNARSSAAPHRIDADSNRPRSVGAALVRGLLTQLSNPKTAVVYASLFTSVLPPDLPFGTALVLPCLVFAVEGGWYSVVAVSLSSPAPREIYFRRKAFIDRLAGTVMAGLGVKLLVDAVREL